MPTFAEYTFTSAGWCPLHASDHCLPVTPADAISDALYQAGYRIHARSAIGRCGVGSFQVWRLHADVPDRPRFAVELLQELEEGVIWIDTLPLLWEFLRLYGMVSLTMTQALPGDEEEDDEDEDADVPHCPDCGAPMTLVAPWEPAHENDYDDA